MQVREEQEALELARKYNELLQGVLLPVMEKMRVVAQVTGLKLNGEEDEDDLPHYGGGYSRESIGDKMARDEHPHHSRNTRQSTGMTDAIKRTSVAQTGRESVVDTDARKRASVADEKDDRDERSNGGRSFSDSSYSAAPFPDVE